eukprot:1005938-Pelagomonas_calceolata.AAC.1
MAICFTCGHFEFCASMHGSTLEGTFKYGHTQRHSEKEQRVLYAIKFCITFMASRTDRKGLEQFKETTFPALKKVDEHGCAPSMLFNRLKAGLNSSIFLDTYIASQKGVG